MTPTLSNAEKLAKIQRYRELLKYKWHCNYSGCDGLPHKGMPHKHARATQCVGSDPVTLFCTGRGFGKTRSAAEFIKERMLSEPKHRVNVIAPSFGVGRDVCVEGESGILAILPPDRIKSWNRSMGELTLVNGSRLKIYGAHTKEDAESIRGSQSHTVWAEELTGWRHPQLAWDMAMFANRLGSDTRVVATCTPKSVPLLRKLFNMPKCKVISGSTLENASNLAPSFVEYLIDNYQGTRLGQQELEGKLLQDVIGAMWSRDLIKYVDNPPADLVRVVVAVDPPGGHRVGFNAQCGLVAVGKASDGMLYVLEDRSDHMTPEQWASATLQLYDDLNADCVVAESNFGGALVESNLRAASSQAKIRMVTATRGKALRAEPVVNLYERYRIKHCGLLPDLEDQQCSWVPPGQVEVDNNGVETPIPASDYSPDRIDALVWAVTELALQAKKPRTVARFH